MKEGRKAEGKKEGRKNKRKEGRKGRKAYEDNLTSNYHQPRAEALG